MSFITCSKGHQNSVGANFCIHCGEILNNVGNAKTQGPSITCPRTYLVPSILVTLFAFLPVGIIAIIFASQVENKYKRGDYDGAVSASKTAKLICIVFGSIAAVIYLLIFLGIGSAILIAMFENQKFQATDSEAKQYVVAVNRTQQSVYLESRYFASTLEQLDLGLQPETENYKYEIFVDETKAQGTVVTAKAKESGLRSYSGAVFATSSDITITAVCETDQPSMSPPEVTQSAEGEIQCSAGSSKLGSE